MTDRFIDFSATNNGDGTAPAQAASPGGVGARNRLSLADYAAGTTWAIWIRRIGNASVTAPVTFNQANISFIGWPQVGDPDYLARPASGTAAGWDADSQTYAQVDSNSILNTIGITNGTAWRRIGFTHTLGTISSAGLWVTVQDCSTEFTNCKFEVQQSSGSGKFDACTVKASATAANCKPTFTGCLFKSTVGRALVSQFNDASYVNCTFTAVSTGTMVLASVQGGDHQLFEDCAFGTSGTCAKPTLLETFPLDLTRIANTFIGCAFDAHLATTWSKTLDIGAAGSFLSCTFAGKKVSIRDPYNKANVSFPTQWTPGVFPIHFQSMTFDATQPPTPDAYISSYPDPTGLFFIVENFDPTDCDLVANNVTMPMPGTSHADHIGQVNYPIAGAGGRFRFRNLDLAIPFAFNDGTISGGRTARSFIGFISYPGVEVLDDVENNLQWAKYSCVGQVSPNSTASFQQVLEAITWAAGGGIKRRCPLRLDEGRVQIFLAAGTHTLTATFTISPSIEMVQWWIEASYLDQASGAHRDTKSSGAGTYWDPAHNSTGGTAAVTLTMLQSGWVELRFFFQDEGIGTKVTPMVVVT